METLMIRHYIMLFVDTGTCKTKIYELLRKAIIKHHKDCVEHY